MEFINEILDLDNMYQAYKRVVSNKGASGIDGMDVKDLYDYISKNSSHIINSIKDGTYKPQPVRRVYIPKPNGDKRPLGIPTAIDRVIQQAIATKLSELYEPLFSDSSFGFRPNRDCHKAMFRAMEYLNEGYEWIVDLDIEKFFDRVNQDKLTSIIREQMNDSKTLKLINKFLKSGVMENGVVVPTKDGMPQGGPLSPILSNIYLDKLDKELETRGLRFVRYADDCIIFVKTKKAAYRVLTSIVSWIERKLFLKVNATKSKVSRPSDTDYLGFTFYNYKDKWTCRPKNAKKRELKDKIRKITIRKICVAKNIRETVYKLNALLRGWINYFKIGRIKTFLKEVIGPMVRNRLRTIIVKQWKNPPTILKNLRKIVKEYKKSNFTEKRLYILANSRKGCYARCVLGGYTSILSIKYLSEFIKTEKGRYGLIDPVAYFMKQA